MKTSGVQTRQCKLMKREKSTFHSVKNCLTKHGQAFYKIQIYKPLDYKFKYKFEPFNHIACGVSAVNEYIKDTKREYIIRYFSWAFYQSKRQPNTSENQF